MPESRVHPSSSLRKRTVAHRGEDESEEINVVAYFQVGKVLLVISILLLLIVLCVYQLISKYGLNISTYSSSFSKQDLIGKLLPLSILCFAPLFVSAVRLFIATVSRKGVAVYERDGLLLLRGGVTLIEPMSGLNQVSVERLEWVPGLNELVVLQFGDGRRKSFSAATFDIDADRVASRIRELMPH